MAKFLNKKEQVFDLQLTTYGKYLMSIGKMQPMYYAFFDDNIIYDSQYTFSFDGATSGRYEPQNEIHGRIKNDTQYFEGLVQFTDIDNLEDQIEPGTDLYFVDVTPTQQVPKLDTFVYEKYIGDAYMDNNKSNYAPAWKIVTLQNKLSASTESNDRLLSRIPQIDMTLYYTKKIKNSPGSNPGDLNSLRQFTNRTPTFSDGNFISLETDDALMYIEELNTILLNENFDVEVFQQTETATIGNFASARLRVIHDVGALAIKNDDTIKFNRNGYTVTFTFKSSTSSATHIELASPAGGTCQDYWDALVQTLINLGDKLNTDTGDGETYAQKLDFYVNFDGSIYESPCGTSAESPSILFEARTLGRGGNDGSVDLSLAHASSGNTEAQFSGFQGGEDNNLEKNYKRKFFKEELSNVQNGFMIADTMTRRPAATLTTSSVEYYFQMIFDQQIDPELACKGSDAFNKESYYIDLDFECDISDDQEVVYVDIYGQATEPEICQ
tara:strand:+ start:8880 stop:10370 length:1491 start_codon:yes stop_codon:yes gene_type:complete